MAQKKITDLSLIGTLLSSMSVPLDNGTATYRFTIAQLTTFLLSVINAVQNISAAGTALTSASSIVLADPSSASFVQDLPALGSWSANQTLTIKNVSTGANTVTLDANAAETIEGSTTLALSAGESVTLIKRTSTDWAII